MEGFVDEQLALGLPQRLGRQFAELAAHQVSLRRHAVGFVKRA
jgi:hypothetical protein